MTLPAWHPDIFAKRRPFLAVRERILQQTRGFFAERDFAEVETPCLQVSPGMEPHLKAFETSLFEPFGQSERKLYLHTSPEFAMKKLLAAGMPRIYQLARCFRNEERSQTHHPEFTMLEWYRSGEELGALMEDCEGLLRAALVASGAEEFRWRGAACSLAHGVRRMTVNEAFSTYAGIDLLASIDDSDEPDPRPLAEMAQVIGISPHPNDRWEDIFFRIFLDRVEPHLGLEIPTFLTDYPICMAALSKANSKDPELAQRFELYVCGLELANAFAELTDSSEQARRFARDQGLKQKLYGTTYPVDDDFILAVSCLANCSGIALGFDRLVMLASHAPGIDDVLWLPVIRP